MNDTDEYYMSKAIELARKGQYHTSPNPMVGAVIVKDGKIIGSGYHEHYGELHAERNALSNCSGSPSGATLYVTLEPCCHYGKTPPCTEAIIKSNIAEVVIGSRDPNPKVSGKGAAILREAGIKVIEDFMRDECDALNHVFFHYITKGTPFVTMKYAMTMDGKIATHTGNSRWISSEASRRHTHLERGRNMAIMIGIGTVLSDDPQLTCRCGDGDNPIRIICDTHLRTPIDSRIITDKSNGRLPRTIIATAVKDESVKAPFIAADVRIITVPVRNEHLDLAFLMKELGKMGIDSVILEGGSTLNWSALSAGIVQRVQAYISPKLFGGAGAKGPVGGDGVEIPDDAFKLRTTNVTHIGEDILIESEVIRCLQE